MSFVSQVPLERLLSGSNLFSLIMILLFPIQKRLQGLSHGFYSLNLFLDVITYFLRTAEEEVKTLQYYNNSGEHQILY